MKKYIAILIILALGGAVAALVFFFVGNSYRTSSDSSQSNNTSEFSQLSGTVISVDASGQSFLMQKRTGEQQIITVEDSTEFTQVIPSIAPAESSPVPEIEIIPISLRDIRSGGQVQIDFSSPMKIQIYR